MKSLFTISNARQYGVYSQWRNNTPSPQFRHRLQANIGWCSSRFHNLQHWVISGNQPDLRRDQPGVPAKQIQMWIGNGPFSQKGYSNAGRQQ
jgi:hypothetical protein